MNSSLLENRRKTRTPPSPPNIKKNEEDWGDNNSRGHVLVYGENEATLKEILHIPRMMADSIWHDMFHLSDFTDIDELNNYLYRKVLQNPKLLVSLTYLITKENVNRCLDSFLGFFEKVPGFSSSSDLHDSVKNIKGILDDEQIRGLSIIDLPEDFLKSTFLRGEPKAHVVNALLCHHIKDKPLALTAEMDPLLERLPDIGDIIRKKFSGIMESHPLDKSIVDQMTDFSIFGGEL